MSAERPFFDTNVLIHVYRLNDPRAEMAELLLAKGGVVGVQTLNEFVSVAHRKLKMPWKLILDALDDIGVLCPSPVPLTVAIHEKALRIAQRYHYHVYDSLMIAAALEASCHTLFSEDMRHGQAIESLTIRNPFRSTAN